MYLRWQIELCQHAWLEREVTQLNVAAPDTDIKLQALSMSGWLSSDVCCMHETHSQSQWRQSWNGTRVVWGKHISTLRASATSVTRRSARKNASHKIALAKAIQTF